MCITAIHEHICRAVSKPDKRKNEKAFGLIARIATSGKEIAYFKLMKEDG